MHYINLNSGQRNADLQIPSFLNSIIYKIKTPEVSNGRFIVKYNVLFILNGQKPLSLPESVWLSSVAAVCVSGFQSFLQGCETGIP